MKRDLGHLSPYRIRSGRLASDEDFGPNGAFLVPYRDHALQIIASDGMGWDHVSVVPVDRRALTDRERRTWHLWRTPTWEEMSFVKDQFFGDDETAIEYHPPKRVYRNAHEYALHLWRPQTVEIPLPDPIMVAPPNLRV